MRLPCDGALIVIDAEGGPEFPPAVAALLEAWRAEGLPRFVVRLEARARTPATDPASGPDAFADGALEAALDDIGATTLVLCGAPASALAASLRHAAALGYRLFVVAEACATDVPASPPERPALAQLDSELARVVTLPTALAAARQAKTRQRLNAAKAAARARAV